MDFRKQLNLNKGDKTQRRMLKWSLLLNSVFVIAMLAQMNFSVKPLPNPDPDPNFSVQPIPKLTVVSEDTSTDSASSLHYQRLHNYRKNHAEYEVGLHEQLLTFYLSSLLREAENGFLLPEGILLDCGAQYGQQAAHFAVTSPHRKVIAMDPSPKLVEQMKKSWGSLPNLEIREGGLSQEDGTLKARDDTFNLGVGAEFKVYSLDSMFYARGERLALAHLDVEGLELEVLRGGVRTIRANEPIFTVELRVHEKTRTKQLLDFIDSEGYDAYVIDEPCGLSHLDQRNLLCIPRKKSVNFGTSDAFNLLLSLNAIFRVTSEDIAEKVLPCCALGGECCPGNDLYGEYCCTESVVLDWYKKHPEAYQKPLPTLSFKEGRWEFQKQQFRLRQRVAMKENGKAKL